MSIFNFLAKRNYCFLSTKFHVKNSYPDSLEAKCGERVNRDSRGLSHLPEKDALPSKNKDYFLKAEVELFT